MHEERILGRVSYPPPSRTPLSLRREWATFQPRIGDQQEETNMRRQSVIAGLALSAVFAGKAQAYVNYPWCLMGDTRGFECVFSSREQCMQDGRNRGFGSQCIQNPSYKPGVPTVSGPAQGPPTVSGPVKKQTATPAQAVNATHSTCTGLKPVCVSDCSQTSMPGPYCENICKFQWERCMKTGWWEGSFFSRSAERR
jgi:Protein of unknown function (DUF3551)